MENNKAETRMVRKERETKRMIKSALLCLSSVIAHAEKEANVKADIGQQQSA